MKHGTYWVYRLVAWSLLVAGIAWAVAIIALRYVVLPSIDDYREPIVRSVTQAVGQKVEIGRIEGNWRGYRPALTFFDVRVHEGGGQQTLALDRVDTVLSWKTLVSGTIVFKLIGFTGSHVEIRRDSLGTLWLAGEALQRRQDGDRSQLMRWLFAQEEIVVRGARVTWLDEMRSAPALQIKDIELRIENDGLNHRLGVTGRPPAELASKLVMSVELKGENPQEFIGSGRVFAEFEYANLALAREWVALPVAIDSGLGVMRLWMDIEDRSLRRVIAETELVNVSGRLDQDLERFQLASLSGRIQWDGNDASNSLAVSDFTLETVDGVRLPPSDIHLKTTRSQPYAHELDVRRLDMAALAALSGLLPFAPDIGQRITKLQPSGVVEELSASWLADESGVRGLKAEASFRDLAADPVGEMPGFSGITGSVSLANGGGSVKLNAGPSELNYPQVFAEPIPFDLLRTQAQWRLDGEMLEVQVDSLSFTNEHAAGKASGTYSYPGHGQGEIDVRAVLVRAHAEHIWRYFPNRLSKTRSWLRQGLVSGDTSEARLRFSGPLEKFPYADPRDGVFEITAAVQGGSVRIGDGWPLIEDISGEFRMDRDRIDINPRVARISGADVSKTRVSILGIGKRDVRLAVDGKAEGEVGQYLQFVASSPVAGYTKRATAGMQGQGIGTLVLKLDYPFFDRANLGVDGFLDMAGPEFVIAQQAPRLGNYAVRVEFDKAGVALRNGRGVLLGGPVRFGSVPGASGKGFPEVVLVGRARANDVAGFLKLALLSRLYGQAEWEGRLRVDSAGTYLRIDSPLVGLGSLLPAPLGKLDSSASLLKTQMWFRRGGQSEYLAQFDGVGSARLLVADGVLERGEVVFAGDAALPGQEGIIARGEIPALDYDGWREVFVDSGSEGLSNAGGRLTSLDLRIGSFLFGGRDFRQVHIAGGRLKDGWKLDLDGPQVKGNLVATADADGQRINARFDSMAIAARPASVAPVTEAAPGPRTHRIPAALNVIVGSLEYEGMPLGRVELLAEPEPDGWRLDRLAISNPDGRFDVKGRWRMEGRPRAEYTVRFDAGDTGNFLKRLGYGETIVGGTGSLSGPVSWLGGPFEPDLPTLNGKLTLEALDGRFAQVDPGAAQLMGILSLQALPRRISLNFKDVFSTGFSFDRISAEVTITDGMARTDDFHMDGISANVSMKGEVDLVSRTQDLEIRVTPMLTGAAAVAGAAVVNPLVGVAALLVQKALGDPVEQAASRQYQVRGTWQDPQVERITPEPVEGGSQVPGR